MSSEISEIKKKGLKPQFLSQKLVRKNSNYFDFIMKSENEVKLDKAREDTVC